MERQKHSAEMARRGKAKVATTAEAKADASANPKGMSERGEKSCGSEKGFEIGAQTRQAQTG
jgi:hypothetical protein